MSELVTHAISSGPPGRQLIMRFNKHEDRFGHQLVCQTKDQANVLLTAINHGEPHVCSPIQEMVTETHHGSDVLLSVGRAGRNHWSGAMTLSEESLVTEIACRVNQSTPWLGSVYRFVADVEVKEFRPTEIVWSMGRRTFELKAGEGSVIEWDEPDHRVVVRATSKPKNLPATVVWCYAFLERF